jgi:hypothetical protein
MSERLNGVEAFVAAVEAGNFALAAQRLRLTVPRNVVAPLRIVAQERCTAVQHRCILNACLGVGGDRWGSRMQNDTMKPESEDERSLHSMLHGPIEPDTLYSAESDGRLFRIRAANSLGLRSSANVLIDRMYATRGYRTTPLPGHQLPTRMTLAASDHDVTVGTITIGFDSDARLYVDDLFASETAALRRRGRKICEFTKLAMDSVVRSKRILASLFHVAYIYAHRMMTFDDLLIEVNPRHVRYYDQMLGFEVMGPPRHNSRVNAPAVLMRLELAYAQRQIARFAGSDDSNADERSLYPLCFSADEEVGIVDRLRRAHADVETGALTSDLTRAERAYRSMH